MAGEKIRILTAGSLFDGHDVAINIMRRIMQHSGAEVIHIGHNRSVHEIVQAAIQEDVHAVAVTSYQGGHMEFFKYMFDSFVELGAAHIKIFGGGGGTILPSEIEALHAYGITSIYSPEDGRKMGLQGMVNDLLSRCDHPLPTPINEIGNDPCGDMELARQLSKIEAGNPTVSVGTDSSDTPVWGVTGTGGAGKSSLVDEVIGRMLIQYPKLRIALISIDPTKRRTGGALLGDRIRMNSVYHPNVYMRSMATRQSHNALNSVLKECIQYLQSLPFNLIIVETSGIGQADSQVADLSTISTYVMTPDFGAPTQLEKIDMLDFAHHVVINKFDKPGAPDALKDVQKQIQRSRQAWDKSLTEMPVFGVCANRFNHQGTNLFFATLCTDLFHDQIVPLPEGAQTTWDHIIPPQRTKYLAEIADTIREYNTRTEEIADAMSKLYALRTVLDHTASDDLRNLARAEIKKLEQEIGQDHVELITKLQTLKAGFREEESIYSVRDRRVTVSNFSRSITGHQIPKIALPSYRDWGDQFQWMRQENFPGYFPFTSGVFPFKRTTENPTRMFAGEGGPERTNRRFHYLSRGQEAKRLSTAFDSVTLYGEDPASRPDIYGKIGNAGVSVCSLDDAKKLYSGFDLTSPGTSVSMTINGPAAAMCAFFLNAAIDQGCEKYILEHNLKSELALAERDKPHDSNGPAYAGTQPPDHNGLGLLLLGITGDEVLPADIYDDIRRQALERVRGTVQADILKEDQAQNTCIFSTEFSLKLMGDMQQYFVDHNINNFYSVSISGYHIAEAGANPITQLAFTLANGFTYVEYYLSRGMKIDDFAPNLSFFFSNGIDPEYAVIGRVARRIWAKAIKNRYGGSKRSQKLKYHIQTSGRSLHAQEISFNDIRTTLQALYAVYDNCNSLHTNAYDEAVTTPTEESVRRALAIQLIINQELGLAKNENPLQGSFIINELTDLVEEAVLLEFENLAHRGGVLGAMESMYQRSKIQEESMHYEMMKHTGEYPLVGVNTFINENRESTDLPPSVIRADKAEKDRQIHNLHHLHMSRRQEAAFHLQRLREGCLAGENSFALLMEAAKYCSLGQITEALYQIGGKYRRNM